MKPLVRLSCSAYVVGIAIVTVLAAGCTGDDEPATLRTPTASPPASTTAPTPDATPALTRADAEAAAETAVHDYLALFADISADPDRDLAELEHVAAGRALDWATHQITTWRDDGQRRVGTPTASEFTVINLVLHPDTTSQADNPVVEMTACLDVSATDIVDENGDSVVNAERFGRVFVDYAVTNLDWPDGENWLVTLDDAQLTDSNPPEFVPCE